MNIRPIYGLIYRYFSLLIARPDRMMGLYIWLLIDMVMWGFISEYLGRIMPSGFNALSTFLGAVLLANFYARAMLNINMVFFEDMWARNFLSLFASPMRIREYLSGLITCGVITSSFGFLLAMISAAVIFDFSPFSYGVPLLAWVLVLLLFGVALGIFGCAMVLWRGPSSEWYIWPIPSIMAPFVGVFYPVASLPEWMQQVATILPPTYVFEQLRAVIAGQPTDLSQLLLGFLLSIGYIILASWVFVRVHRRMIRTGLIARYNAETSA